MYDHLFATASGFPNLYIKLFIIPLLLSIFFLLPFLFLLCYNNIVINLLLFLKLLLLATILQLNIRHEEVLQRVWP